jgi:hypothetical protein
LVQLPDTLPGEPAYSEDDDKEKDKTKVKNKTEVRIWLKKISPFSVMYFFSLQDDLSQKLKMCSLGDFQEGHIGKLRVHQSGKTTLQMGSVCLDVSMGTPASFLQVWYSET